MFLSFGESKYRRIFTVDDTAAPSSYCANFSFNQTELVNK